MRGDDLKTALKILLVISGCMLLVGCGIMGAVLLSTMYIQS